MAKSYTTWTTRPGYVRSKPKGPIVRHDGGPYENPSGVVGLDRRDWTEAQGEHPTRSISKTVKSNSTRNYGAGVGGFSARLGKGGKI